MNQNRFKITYFAGFLLRNYNRFCKQFFEQFFEQFTRKKQLNHQFSLKNYYTSPILTLKQYFDNSKYCDQLYCAMVS